VATKLKPHISSQVSIPGYPQDTTKSKLSLRSRNKTAAHQAIGQKSEQSFEVSIKRFVFTIEAKARNSYTQSHLSPHYPPKVPIRLCTVQDIKQFKQHLNREAFQISSVFLHTVFPLDIITRGSGSAVQTSQPQVSRFAGQHNSRIIQSSNPTHPPSQTDYFCILLLPRPADLSPSTAHPAVLFPTSFRLPLAPPIALPNRVISNCYWHSLLPTARVTILQTS